MTEHYRKLKRPNKDDSVLYYKVLALGYYNWMLRELKCVLHLFTLRCFHFFRRGTFLDSDNEQNDGICITIGAFSWFLQS